MKMEVGVGNRQLESFLLSDFCLARLGTLNVPCRPARRSLGEVGRDGLIIGRHFSFSAGY